MEKISERKEEVLHRVKGGEEYSTHNKRKKGNWIGHILRRKCPVKHITDGETEGRKDKEEYESSHWMSIKKREESLNLVKIRQK
jgi:hypothetical protein